MKEIISNVKIPFFSLVDISAANHTFSLAQCQGQCQEQNNRAREENPSYFSLFFHQRIFPKREYRIHSNTHRHYVYKSQIGET